MNQIIENIDPKYYPAVIIVLLPIIFFLLKLIYKFFIEKLEDIKSEKEEFKTAREELRRDILEVYQKIHDSALEVNKSFNSMRSEFIKFREESAKQTSKFLVEIERIKTHLATINDNIDLNKIVTEHQDKIIFLEKNANMNKGDLKKMGTLIDYVREESARAKKAASANTDALEAALNIAKRQKYELENFSKRCDFIEREHDRLKEFISNAAAKNRSNK